MKLNRVTGLTAPTFGFVPRNIYVKTDYNDGASTTEIHARGYAPALDWALENQSRTLPEGFQWADDSLKNKRPFLPTFLTYHDNPIANVDYASLSLYRLGSFRNKNIYVHVTDPGVGFHANHDRSLLMTENYGIYIGPNNGSLGKIGDFLERQKEPYQLYAIDFDKLTQLERVRLGNKNYSIPNIIHGRDAFGVIAGYIAGGIEPKSFADTQRGELSLKKTPFSSPPQDLSAIEHGEIRTYAIQDRTFGNIILNTTVSPGYARKLADENAVLELSRTDDPSKKVQVSAKHFFSEVPEGNYLIYPGSPIEFQTGLNGQWEQKLLLGGAQNYQGGIDYGGGIAKPLGMKLVGSFPITIKQVKNKFRAVA